MFRKSILGIVAVAAISLWGALPSPAAAGGDTGTLTTAQLTPTTAAVPLVGDFNADGADDILWYGRGTAADSVWLNDIVDGPGSVVAVAPVVTPANSFTVVPVTINGNYTPVVGDFDGNHADDVFWYQAGTGADSVWYFGVGDDVLSVPMTINGSYRPIVGNFDTVDASNATEQDDIFWYALNSGLSSLSSGNTNRTFTTRTYSVRPPAGAQTLVGDFELGSAAPSPDIFFYTPGTSADSLWVSDGTGAFVRKAKAVHGQFVPIVGNFDQAGTRVPLPSEEIPEYGTAATYDGVSSAVLDAKADGCFAGNLTNCDELHTLGDDHHEDIPEGYHSYGERCGARRGPGPVNCVVLDFPASPAGLDDIIWYGPGAGVDKVWLNTGGGTFSINPVSIPLNVTPTVIRSGPGGYTGGDRILWNGTGIESVWAPDVSGLAFSSTTVADMGTTRKPVVGDFTRQDLPSQYLQNEVLWYAPGNNLDQKETLWLTPGGAWPT